MEGMQVYNDYGFLQIDSSYRNYSLKYKSVVTFSGVYEIPYDCDSGDVIAFSGTSHAVAVVVKSNRFTIKCALGVASATVEVFIFGYQDSPSPSGQGMQIFDDQGRAAFDSGRLYMRVLANIKAPDYNENVANFNDTQNFSYSSAAPAVEKVAVTYPISRIYEITEGATGDIFRPDGPIYRVLDHVYVGSVIEIKAYRTTQQGLGSLNIAIPFRKFSGPALILDVTNF